MTEDFTRQVGNCKDYRLVCIQTTERGEMNGFSYGCKRAD